MVFNVATTLCLCSPMLRLMWWRFVQEVVVGFPEWISGALLCVVLVSIIAWRVLTMAVSSAAVCLSLEITRSTRWRSSGLVEPATESGLSL